MPVCVHVHACVCACVVSGDRGDGGAAHDTSAACVCAFQVTGVMMDRVRAMAFDWEAKAGIFSAAESMLVPVMAVVNSSSVLGDANAGEGRVSQVQSLAVSDTVSRSLAVSETVSQSEA